MVDLILSAKRLQKKAGIISGLSTFYQQPEDLIRAKLRMIKATVPRERAPKDEDDIRALLKFTKVNTKTVRRQAKKDNTLSILETVATKSNHQSKKRPPKSMH
jgi:hypothetical protein